MPVIGGGGGSISLLPAVAVMFNTPGITAPPGVTIATIPAGALFLGAYVTLQTAWDADPDNAALDLQGPDGLALGLWTVAANWATVDNSSSTPQYSGAMDSPRPGVTLGDTARMRRASAPWTLSALASSTVGATMGAATVVPIVLAA